MPRLALSALLALGLLAPLLALATTSAPPSASAAAAFALPAFQEVWAAADGPVAAGAVSRTWLWGPTPLAEGQREPYADAPDGQRLVQYFDKARMEDNRWRAADDPLWRVTTGRLVAELITGARQTGDAASQQAAPARVSVAGDPGSGPTYADLAGRLGQPAAADGTTITARLLPGGRVETSQPPVEVRTGRRAPEARQSIADPFWAFMTGAGAVRGNPFFATGLPLTEPYWAEVRLAGAPRRVLLQAFERRVLTYTPGNAAGFEVEMGNVGQHYHLWRYGALPPAPAPMPQPAIGPLQPTPLTIAPAVEAVTPADRLQRFRDRTVMLPPGFSIGLFAVLDSPRFMAVSPAGEVYVAQKDAGSIVALPDADRDGVADAAVVVAEGLNAPHSLAFHQGALHVGETDRVARLTLDPVGRQATDRATVVELPARQSHWSRTVSFGPDGKLYVSVGSTANVVEETDWRRAAILQYNADGSGGRVYARGLRNSVGLAWQPGTGRLYATENGRDGMGDDVPPEEINEIRDGGDYGWPRCHGADIRDPRFGQAPDACAGQIAPVVLMQAHSAPLGLAFVETAAFPAAARGDLIVAFHGSWNRSQKTGYKLVRVPFRDGHPTGQVEDFLTGFLIGQNAWSRPTDVVFGPDGALYVSDDAGGAIYRVTYAPSGP